MKKYSIFFLAFFLLSFQAHAMKRRVRGLASCFKRCGGSGVTVLLARKHGLKLRSSICGLNGTGVSSVRHITDQKKRYYVVDHDNQKDLLDFDEKEFDELIAEKFQLMTVQEKLQFFEGLKALENNSLGSQDAVPLVANLVFQLIKPEQLSPEDQAALKKLIAQHADAVLAEVENIYDWSHDHIKNRTLIGKGIVYSVAGLTVLNVVVSFSVLVLAVVYACYPELLGEKKEQDSIL